MWPDEQLFAYELVDRYFDKTWCEETFDILAQGKSTRKMFLTGADIGDEARANLRYYVFFC